MSRYVFKLPDLGEGTVEAELSAWHVKAGDLVKEDQVIAEVMTEKAAVELPSPVTGRVISTTGQAGDVLKVGSELIVFETGTEAEGAAPPVSPEPAKAVAPAATRAPEQAPAMVPAHAPAQPSVPALAQARTPAAASRPALAPNSASPSVASGAAARVMASPATRRRAHQAGIDLTTVQGSGPGGRITPSDITKSPVRAPAAGSGAATEEIRVIGLRRLIAQRMSEAKRTIPHFAYVEEVDITELESLRTHLNETREPDAPSLSYLPFIIAALVRALERFPQCNAVYDAQRETIVRHRAVHLGIATQTPDGLLVPVMRHAETLSVTQIAEQLRALAARARARKSPREELSGSTITLTSLGKLGGIVSTPVINSPEVAIIGVNKAIERPVIRNGAIAARLMMNLSSSFDHRFVDGYDAAAMIQELKGLLEHPATIFMQR